MARKLTNKPVIMSQVFFYSFLIVYSILDAYQEHKKKERNKRE